MTARPTPAVGGREGVATAATLLSVSGLRVRAQTPDGPVDIVDGIDLNVERGQIVAIVGESGSGKTMTAMAIARLLPPGIQIAGGSVRLGGRELTTLGDRELDEIRGRRVGMLFQHPKAALDPTSQVGKQISEAYRLERGKSSSRARARSIELLAAVGIADPDRRVDAYSFQLSGGMAQRVMIAAALSGEPELLIADEPTTALDVTVQAQILRLLRGMSRDRGLAIVLITHDLGVVSTIADYVAVMYAGRIVEQGPTEELIATHRHPYTEALLRASMLTPEPDGRLYTIPGGVPRPGQLVSGCRFLSRCTYHERLGITAQCAGQEPGMCMCGGANHEARCFAVEAGLVGSAEEVAAQ